VSDVRPPSGAGGAAGRGDGIGQGRVRRSAPLVSLAARTAGEAVLMGLRDRLAGADRTEGADRSFHMRTAERYAELLGRSKGALMKAGQMLSFTSAAPAVPAEFQSIYQTALARLRSDAPPMAAQLARDVLERELGRPAERAFAEFDWQPLAAASVGQVHAARLHDGRAVAVKIQYPGAADAIVADLKNAELLATFLSLMLGGLSPRKLSIDLRAAAREISVRIGEELDYRREAANQAEFAAHYRGHPFIHVPEVIAELCTDRVLTQELVGGRCFSDALTAGQELRNKWAEAIHRFTFGSYHRFLLFNADPHPGNYLFHEDGSVSFLDFGCVKRFRREQVQMMDAIVRACLRNDVLGTWRASVEFGFWRSTDPVTPEEVFDYIRSHLGLLWADQPCTITPERVAAQIERRFSSGDPSANAFRYISPPPEYTLMSRIEIGAASVIAQLRASNHWGALAAEQFEGAAPLTEMGKREHAFFDKPRAGSHA
jgi:predicted unusual protein kinase regulating ubiquinone biosynthesis (AarF/ABC1/UbiB family)